MFHSDYSKRPPVTRMQAWLETSAPLVMPSSLTLRCTPTRISIRRCLKLFLFCAFVW